MSVAHVRNLVLAVYPFSQGFAFVFLEGPDSPYEWGIKEVKGKYKNTKTVDELKKLIDRYRPEVLVIENTNGGSRRTSRIRKLYRMILHLAVAEFVDLYRYRNDEVIEYFASVGARTKHEIARAIALQIPAFALRMPPFRKPWMSKDSRQSLFDAVALALVFYRKIGHPDSRSPDEV